jgi:hypothetical protein
MYPCSLVAPLSSPPLRATRIASQHESWLAAVSGLEPEVVAAEVAVADISASMLQLRTTMEELYAKASRGFG